MNTLTNTYLRVEVVLQRLLFERPRETYFKGIFSLTETENMKRIFTTILVLATTSAVKAQTTGSASQTIKITIEPIIKITALSENVNMGFSTLNHYSSGVVSTNNQFKVQSNKDFVVSVNTDASSFAYTGSTYPSPTMPVDNILHIAVASNQTGGNVANSFENYKSLSNTPQDLILNCKNGGDQIFAVNYKATPGTNYPAGDYVIGVVYTATQP